MKHTKNMIIHETSESRELQLFAENDSATYFRSIVPAVRNLAKKYQAGKYNREKAVDMFYYVACSAAAEYCRQFARAEDMPRMFDVTARYTAAAGLLDAFTENIENNDI